MTTLRVELRPFIDWPEQAQVRVYLDDGLIWENHWRLTDDGPCNPTRANVDFWLPLRMLMRNRGHAER